MLIKSGEAEDHEANLMEGFKNLRRNKLRLNPDKCVFGVTSGKFLGYMCPGKGGGQGSKANVLRHPSHERGRDKLSLDGAIGVFLHRRQRYKMLPEATVVEWVEEEAFRTKDVMNNDAPEGWGVLGALVPGGVGLLKDRGLTQRASGG
ncbi:hypothetical protein LIER_40882 [Lithospermum erythrorhizon]|uniref:Reverse transcriptase domain-containing protein n=1 Tax=Lithospermum erythrorhizon TaxID=34254 RepID=A0AAV3R596_LITER